MPMNASSSCRSLKLVETGEGSAERLAKLNRVETAQMPHCLSTVRAMARTFETVEDFCLKQFADA